MRGRRGQTTVPDQALDSATRDEIGMLMLVVAQDPNKEIIIPVLTEVVHRMLTSARHAVTPPKRSGGSSIHKKSDVKPAARERSEEESDMMTSGEESEGKQAACAGRAPRGIRGVEAGTSSAPRAPKGVHAQTSGESPEGARARGAAAEEADCLEQPDGEGRTAAYWRTHRRHDRRTAQRQRRLHAPTHASNVSDTEGEPAPPAEDITGHDDEIAAACGSLAAAGGSTSDLTSGSAAGGARTSRQPNQGARTTDSGDPGVGSGASTKSSSVSGGAGVTGRLGPQPASEPVQGVDANRLTFTVINRQGRLAVGTQDRGGRQGRTAPGDGTGEGAHSTGDTQASRTTGTAQAGAGTVQANPKRRRQGVAHQGAGAATQRTPERKKKKNKLPTSGGRWP